MSKLGKLVNDVHCEAPFSPIKEPPINSPDYREAVDALAQYLATPEGLFEAIDTIVVMVRDMSDGQREIFSWLAGIAKRAMQ